MKKSLALALVLLLIIPAVVACSNVRFTINFMVDGQQYSSITTDGSSVVEMPEDPTKAGYEFKGWYWDEGTWQKPFTANSLLDAPLSSNMSVYAYFAKPGTPNVDNGGNNNNSGNNNSGNNGATDTEFSDGAYVTNPCDTVMVHSYTDGVNNYYVYKIGRVERVPILTYSEFTHIQGESSPELTIVKGSVIVDQISFSTSETASKVVSSSVSAKLESSIGSNVGASYKGLVSAEMSSKVSTEIASNISGTYSSTSSEEFKEECRQENSMVTTLKYPISIDAPSGYYCAAITCAFDVYVTVICNIPEMTSSYSYSMLAIEGSVRANDIIYSKSAVLEPKSELGFDESVLSEIDLFGDIEDNRFVEKTFDFSQIYKDAYGVYDFDYRSRLAEEFPDNYDKTTGVFKLYSRIDDKNVDQYKIVGMYGKPNSQGYIIDTVIWDISFCLFTTHDIEIVFDSFAFEGQLFMDKNTSPDADLTIKSAGEKNLIGGKSPLGEYVFSGSPDYSTILADKVNSVTFTGYANMSIGGSTYVDRTGLAWGTPNAYYDGGIAVYAKNVFVDMSDGVSLTLQGGNGSDLAGYTNEKDGRAGGNGGNAVMCESFAVRNGVCNVLGGNGGSGYKAKYGGTNVAGGNGGNGGNGGCGIASNATGFTQNVAVAVEGGSLRVIGGNGGNGGEGGAGGNGQNAQWLGQSAKNGCNGGKGGNGGSGGDAISGDSISITDTDLITLTGGNAGSGGHGGRGGDGGQPVVVTVKTSGGKGGAGGVAGSAGVAIGGTASESVEKITAVDGASASDGVTRPDGTGKSA